jgi:hypothetical protein
MGAPVRAKLSVFEPGKSHCAALKAITTRTRQEEVEVAHRKDRVSKGGGMASMLGKTY